MGTVLRFGPYEFFPASRELYAHGSKLKIRPQPLQILNLLLNRPGEVVTREELRQKLWSAGTFVDFEHGLNTSIKELRAVLDDSASEPRYIETLPKFGYRLVVPVEVASSGNAGRTFHAPDGDHVMGEAGNAPLANGAVGIPFVLSGYRMLRIAIAIALVLMIGGLVVWPKLRTRPEAANSQLMIAVLPLENLTGDPAQDYFSDGLTEEMIAQLGQLDPQHVRVIARTSVMHYKKPEKIQLSQIARELGVQYLLEGSVRRDSGRVRIAMELIQLKDQASVWSREYDRDLNGLLDLQGEIAEDVARKTQLTLENGHVPIEFGRKRVASPRSYETYDLYLKGRYFWNKRTKEGFQRAAEYFQEAMAKDPYYGQAYAGLADTYGLMCTWRLVPHDEFMPKARAAARRALEIDETLAEAHTSLALVLENYDYDWQGAEREFRRAIELDPDYATAHQWYAEYLSWQGRFDEALEESERARQIDPLSLIVATDHGAILYFARNYDRAITQLRAVLDMDPGFDRARMLLAVVYADKGDFAKARDSLRYRPDPDDLPMALALKTYVYGRSGRNVEAQQELARVEELARHAETDPDAALLFAYLGVDHKDQAIALLERARLARSNVVVGVKAAPYYDPLRSDLRFQTLVQRVGLSQ